MAVAAVVQWLDFQGVAAGRFGAACLGVAAGLAMALCGFLLHEWGHLAGALLARSRVQVAERWWSPFLFRFDVVRNGRREFLAMSYGGYVGAALGLALVVIATRSDRLSGQVSLVAIALGVLAIVLSEVPTTLRVLRGGPLPVSGIVYTGAEAAPPAARDEHDGR